MSDDLPISEFKAIIGDLADRYPLARFDFVYPKRFRGEKRGQLGHMTGFEFLRLGNGILRFSLDHCRSDNPDPDGP